MPQPMGFHVRMGWSGWLVLLISLGVVFAIAAVVAIVLLGAFIVLLPVVLISTLLFYSVPEPQTPAPGPRAEVDIIEGEYRVVDPRQLDRDSPPDDRT